MTNKVGDKVKYKIKEQTYTGIVEKVNPQTLSVQTGKVLRKIPFRIVVESKKTTTKKVKVRKPRGLEIMGNENQYNVIYDVAGITIKLDYRISNDKGLYLFLISNVNPKKKGKAREILYDIVNYLYSLKRIKLTDTFTLNAESPKGKGYSQEGLLNMYKKLGFKITSGNNMSQTIKSYLASNE